MLLLIWNIYLQSWDLLLLNSLFSVFCLTLGTSTTMRYWSQTMKINSRYIFECLLNPIYTFYTWLDCVNKWLTFEDIQDRVKTKPFWFTNWITYRFSWLLWESVHWWLMLKLQRQFISITGNQFILFVNFKAKFVCWRYKSSKCKKKRKTNAIYHIYWWCNWSHSWLLNSFC